MDERRGYEKSLKVGRTAAEKKESRESEERREKEGARKREIRQVSCRGNDKDSVAGGPRLKNN